MERPVRLKAGKKPTPKQIETWEALQSAPVRQARKAAQKRTEKPE